MSTAMIRLAPAIAAPLMQDKPNPAAADHRDRCARLDLRGVNHRADTGGDAAADQCGAVQRHVFADLRHRMLVHQHVFGEGTEVGELLQRCRRPG